MKVKNSSKLYLMSVLVAGIQLAVAFGLDLSDAQEMALYVFLAALFGGWTAYDDPRVPAGRK